MYCLKVIGRRQESLVCELSEGDGKTKRPFRGVFKDDVGDVAGTFMSFLQTHEYVVASREWDVFSVVSL